LRQPNEYSGDEAVLARARAVMLTNYYEVARFAGLDPFEMLAAARLKPTALLDPENWLPADRALWLIDESAIRSGRDDFGVLLGKCRTFTSLGPVSLLLKHEKTVQDIILAIVEYRYLLNDLLNIEIEDDGTTAIVKWDLIPGLHSTQGGNLIAAITYRGISEALEETWIPDCIHFRHAAPHHAATFKRYFRCSLEYESSFDGMSCTTKALRTPNPFADADLAAYSRRLLNLLPGARDESAISKVRSVLVLLIQEGQATAERTAECLGVQVRTLQRRLDNEGSSFGGVLNEIRRELAVRYLANSNHSLTTVAHLTGYSSMSSFSRWFIAEFQVAPAEWRRRNRRQLH